MALLVNGEYVADQLFFEEFHRLQAEVTGSRDQQLSADVLRHTAQERVIRRTLLRQMAVKAGLNIPADEMEGERRRRWGSSSNSVCGVGIMDAIETELLIGKMSAALTRHVFRPSRSDVERFYKSSPASFYEPERVEAAHIVKNMEVASQENEARGILVQAEKELDAGKSFAKVADRYSDCPGSGGALGWIPRGEMVEEFDEVVFALKKHERSPVFRTIFGWHIAIVTGKKAAGPQPLEEVRPALAKRMYEARCQEVIAEVVADVARRSTIVAAPANEHGSVVVGEITI